MNIQTSDQFKSQQILRQRATPKTVRKSEEWEKWEAIPQEPFEITYDQAVSFCVASGQATIEFDNGTDLEISTGDFVRINPGVKGIWHVKDKIVNFYIYNSEFNAE